MRSDPVYSNLVGNFSDGSQEVQGMIWVTTLEHTITDKSWGHFQSANFCFLVSEDRLLLPTPPSGCSVLSNFC